jgi:serine/threonine protein kinase
MAELTRAVGRYEVLERIGRGGMAVVYRARQTHPRRLVALKELRALHDDDPSYAQRFLREADLAGALSHRSIVTVYDYFEHEGTPYIAMEYVEGGSLRPYLGGMPLPQICGVLEDLLAGLSYAERAGVVHRDLKPENVMVTSEGHAKIADFGIAKATTQMQTGAFLTGTGITVGTPRYMAPEQAMAQEIGPWTDLYSLGCLAFEMLTGRAPFDESEAPMAILMRHVNEPIPSVSSLVPSVDEELSAWVARLLIKDPEARTRSARAACDELDEIAIALLGSRWNRNARLHPLLDIADAYPPLTPTPFPATDAGVPGPYTPPPADLPPGPLRPSHTPEGYETFQAHEPPRPPSQEPSTSDLDALRDDPLPGKPSAEDPETPASPSEDDQSPPTTAAAAPSPLAASHDDEPPPGDAAALERDHVLGRDAESSSASPRLEGPGAADEPDTTLPPTRAASYHGIPVPLPWHRRRLRLAVATAALVLGVAVAIAILASGALDGSKAEHAAQQATPTPSVTPSRSPSPTPSPTPVPQVSPAEARDFLDRFVGRFRAEDVTGLKRLFDSLGGDYRYAGGDYFPAEDEYHELFDDLRVVNYKLSRVRISTGGTGATIRARYSYGSRDKSTTWPHSGTATFYLRDRGHGDGVGLHRVVVYPDLVIAVRTAVPTTLGARATIGTKQPIVVGSTTRRVTAGEHFLTIPLNSTGRKKLHAGMKPRVRGEDSNGGVWRDTTVTPYAT